MGVKSTIKIYFRRRKKIKRFKSTFLESVSKNLYINDSKTSVNQLEIPLVSVIVICSQKETNKDFFSFLTQNTAIPIEIILVTSADEKLGSGNYKKIKFSEEDEDLIPKVNLAITASTGDYIYFLNNKFNVGKAYLEELLSVFNTFPECGITGSQVISNGFTGQNLFYNQQLNGNATKNIYNPEVNFTQRADFYTDFHFLVKKFGQNGNVISFNEVYKSIPHCIADFCFSIKFEQQKQAYVSPFSKAFQYQLDKKNIKKHHDAGQFAENWGHIIKNIKSNSAEERIQELYEKSVMIYCRPFPEHDRDSGSNRLKEIIESFRSLGFFVIVYSKNTFFDNPYILDYLKNGVHVYYEFEKNVSIKKHLLSQKINPDLFWFYGPITFVKNYKLAQDFFPKSKLVYDMVDVHHLRFKRAIELEPKNSSLVKKYNYHKKIEIKSSKIADHIIAISEFEKNYMSDFCAIEKIKTVSNVHYPKIDRKKTFSFENRKDILFIGSIHAPNIDALNYLFNEIMPLVWKKIPDLKINIIGNVKNSIKNLNHPNFNFLGYISDIEEYFISSKFMVAPLRYGAGVKGKIGQSLEYYLPVITSSIGAEGMKLVDRESALIQDSPEGFANAIVDLYTNQILWEALQNNSEKSLEPFSKEKLNDILRKISQ